MIFYFLLWVAVILGQLFVSNITVWHYQRSNSNINFFQALKVYFQKEVGTYMVITTFTMLLTFILSDWMDLSLSKADLLSKVELNRYEEIQKKFRTYATVYGMFAQLIAGMVYQGGKNAIQQFGKSKGIDTNN